MPLYVFMAWCLIKPRDNADVSSQKPVMLIHLFCVHRFGPAVLAAREGELGDSLSHEGAPPCGEGDIPGASVQLPGTSDGLEMFYVPHICVSTHPDGDDPYICLRVCMHVM
jgi:hypothetical protein